MTTSTAPVLAPTPRGPERILAIDSIRSLALLGVIIMNVGAMVMRFNGPAVMAAADGLDISLMITDLLLFQGKARACFAFLFGLGFAMMMLRAEAKGADFRTIYIRRMLGLLGFGIVNQVFLFWGDILVLYALLGLLLLPARHWSEPTVLRAGLALVLVPPLIIGAIEVFAGPIPGLMASSAGEGARGLAAMTSPHYRDFIAFAWDQGVERRLTDTAHMVIYDLNVLGLFLLGSWAARRGIPFDVAAHRPLLRRIAAICIPLGILLSLVSASRLAGFHAEGLLYGLVTAAAMGPPILAFGYLAGLTLLFASRLRGFQALIAPAGRMPLTNYLASGAIGCWFFYGYGLGMMRGMDMTMLTLAGVAIFLLLLAFSHVWLARFRLGPLEWLWRRMTYGRLPLAPPRAVAAQG